jgi:hypothetical protein
MYGSALAEPARQATPAKPVWKFDFTVSEAEDGKVINERHYSMLLLAEESSKSIRVGNRVPIVTRINDVQSVNYLDVGVSIDCYVREVRQGDTQVSVTFEVSSLVPDQFIGGNPVLRFVRGSGVFHLNPGKKEVIVTADDINSKRRYQLSLLATRPN